jgi:subtilisin family serine protease
MRRIFLSLFLMSALSIVAQERSKLDLRTYQKLVNGAERQKSLSLLVKGNAAVLKEVVASYGGEVNYMYGNIASVKIPAVNALEFSRHDAIQYIENASVVGMPMMDTARVRNNIDSAYAGLAPLTQPYTGKGVVIGFIDGGIYWQHADFRKRDSTTRIRFIWDQTITGGANPPQPYSYGNEWNWIAIDGGQCTHRPEYLTSEFGHGTCVAGIAAGDGSSYAQDTNLTRGVAPDAEIIMVKVNYNNFLTNVADAVDYIFKKADALGKPCVINTSVGTYYGSHDGRDLASQIIDSLLDQKKGRVLVASAGNAGNIKHHVGYNITADSAYTYFTYNSTFQGVYFDFWADPADFNQAQFTIGAADISGGSIADLGQFSYMNVLQDFNPGATGVQVNRSLYNGVDLVGLVKIFAEQQGGAYHVEFLITPVDNSHWWRLQTKGSGKIDYWSTSNSILGSSDMVEVLPNLAIIPEYRYPDSLKTMVSSWQCSDKVITVGNYSNRAAYYDADSNRIDLTSNAYNEVVGKRYYTSSLGPTRDNRLKPDISATGSTTITTGDGNLIGTYLSNANRFKVAFTRKHIRNGGTSMAGPIVAGVAALYLQKHPTASYAEIKKAIIENATKDSFTTNTPNPEYGYGKVNAFRTLTASYIYGCMDTGSTNYNPAATVDTGGCIKKVYGCLDTNAVNYNAQANVTNGTCTYDTSVGIRNIEKSTIAIKAVPNPFNIGVTFMVDKMPAEFNTGAIVVNDILGRGEAEIRISRGQYAYYLEGTYLAAGLHIFKVVMDGKTVYTGKLIKQ